MKKIISNSLLVCILIVLTLILIHCHNSVDGNKETVPDNLAKERKPSPEEFDKIYGKINDPGIIKNDIEFAKNYQQLGLFYQLSFEYQNALNSYTKGFFYAQNSKDDKLIADISYKIAGIYLELGDYIKAYEFALKVDSIDQKINDNLKRAETLNLLGNIYRESGLFVKSLATHFESLALQRESNNQIGIANTYHNLANLYMDAQRYDKAYTFYSRALEIYTLSSAKQNITDNQINRAKIHLAMGNYYITQGDSTLAKENLDTAFEIFSQKDNKVFIAHTLLFTGNLYFTYENYQKALFYYKKSLDIFTSAENKIGISITYLNLGKLYYIEKEFKQALDYLKYSLQISEIIGARQKIAETSEILYHIYRNFPDSIEKTKHYAEIYIANKSYLPFEKIQDSIIELSIKHEVILHKNEEMALLKYKNKTRIVLILALFIILVITISWVYFYSRVKQRRRYEKKIAEEQIVRFKAVINAIENERKRIAVDLHDGLGQMLSTTKLYLSGLEELIEHQNENDRKLYENTINLLDETCGELRNISYNIMPSSFIKYGLIVAVKEVVVRINESHNIKVDFSHKGFDKRQDENLEIAIYRIIQEALNNILKHADAKLVTLHLEKEYETFELSIKDNGKGMEDFELHKNKGLGWKSIFSRVQMLNGTIDVNTSIDDGTQIDIQIPVS